MTAGFVYGYAGTPSTVPLDTIAPWMTWAQTDQPHAAMLRGAGIKVAVYTVFWRDYAINNPILGYTDLAPGGAHAAAEARDCNGNVLTDPSYGGGYEADARNSAALGHAQVLINYVKNQFGTDYDAIYSDQTAAMGGMPAPCQYVQSTYDAAVNNVDASLGVPMLLNALGAFADPSSAVDLTDPANVLGAMCELCYGKNTSGSDSVDTGTRWQNIENAEIQVAAKHKIFWDYARLTGDPTAETSLRTYVYASFLLSYDPAYTMFEEALQTNSGFPVMPEVGLVAEQPLTTQSSVSGYVAPGGAYFREFAACYYRGAFVNKCAVAVNPGTTSEPVPSTSYFHSMMLSGSGVLDGGTVGFTGPKVTQLVPGSAAILFP